MTWMQQMWTAEKLLIIRAMRQCVELQRHVHTHKQKVCLSVHTPKINNGVTIQYEYNWAAKTDWHICADVRNKSKMTCFGCQIDALLFPCYFLKWKLVDFFGLFSAPRTKCCYVCYFAVEAVPTFKNLAHFHAFRCCYLQPISRIGMW